MFIHWYQYRPGPRVDRESKKEKLQNKMAYGIEDPVKEYRKKKKDDEKKPNPKDRFEELEKEINERESFLADMTRIGQGQLLLRAQLSQFFANGFYSEQLSMPIFTKIAHKLYKRCIITLFCNKYLDKIAKSWTKNRILEI